MVNQISAEEVRKLLDREELTLIDIRDEVSFEESHIQGALRIDNENIQGFIEQADRDKTIVCYCYHGISSLGVSQYFMDCGFKKVYSLIGGFEAWESG